VRKREKEKVYDLEDVMGLQVIGEWKSNAHVFDDGG
jgi:hypothetical protein